MTSPDTEALLLQGIRAAFATAEGNVQTPERIVDFLRVAYIPDIEARLLALTDRERDMRDTLRTIADAALGIARLAAQPDAPEERERALEAAAIRATWCGQCDDDLPATPERIAVWEWSDEDGMERVCDQHKHNHFYSHGPTSVAANVALRAALAPQPDAPEAAPKRTTCDPSLDGFHANPHVGCILR